MASRWPASSCVVLRRGANARIGLDGREIVGHVLREIVQIVDQALIVVVDQIRRSLRLAANDVGQIGAGRQTGVDHGGILRGDAGFQLDGDAEALFGDLVDLLEHRALFHVKGIIHIRRVGQEHGDFHHFLLREGRREHGQQHQECQQQGYEFFHEITSFFFSYGPRPQNSVMKLTPSGSRA